MSINQTNVVDGQTGDTLVCVLTNEMEGQTDAVVCVLTNETEDQTDAVVCVFINATEGQIIMVVCEDTNNGGLLSQTKWER